MDPTAPQPVVTPQRHRSAARRAILQATESLLLEGGAEQLSIRRVSERCGYTAPTIYHHFGDKTGLINAVVEEHFRKLLTRLRRVPRSRDAARYHRNLARAVIRFGLENPTHYRLMSAPRLESADLLPSAEAARALVQQALQAVARERAPRVSDPEVLFQTAWAVVHGLISLRISRPDYPWAEGLVESALDMIDRGLLGLREKRTRR